MCTQAGSFGGKDMKWLKSTTQKTWTVNGKVIPACVTPNNSYLVLDDNDYSEIKDVPVIKSLIKAGGILVLEQEPAELKNSVEALQGSNAALTAKITQLEEQLKAAGDVDIEAVKEEAVKELKEEAIAELQEKDNRIAELEKQLKAAEKKLKESK